jgi:hypothetical protein
MILESTHDRMLLLKAGFTGKQIEKLFLDLNSFEIVGVNWQPDLAETLGKLWAFCRGVRT